MVSEGTNLASIFQILAFTMKLQLHNPSQNIPFILEYVQMLLIPFQSLDVRKDFGKQHPQRRS